MNKLERGVKRRCASCEAPFYDMLRYPISCPKCGAVFDPTAGKKKLASVPRPPKARTTKSGFAAKSAPRPAPEDVEVNAPVAVVADDEALDDAEVEEAEVEEAEHDAADEDEAGNEPVEDDGDDNVTGDH